MTCHFVEFLWHENSQTELEKKIMCISSYSPIITAGSPVWVRVCTHSDGVWFSQTCLAYRLCLSLRDWIFCHPAVWILILFSLRVMESHCSPDWHDSQPSRQPLPWPVCLVQCHLQWLTVLRKDRWSERNHSTALITSLHHFIHCLSLWTLTVTQFKVRSHGWEKRSNPAQFMLLIISWIILFNVNVRNQVFLPCYQLLILVMGNN